MVDTFKERIIDSDIGRQGTADITGMKEFDKQMESIGFETNKFRSNMIGINDAMTKYLKTQKLLTEIETKALSVGPSGFGTIGRQAIRKAPALWTTAKISEQLGKIPLEKVGKAANVASIKLSSVYGQTVRLTESQIFLGKAYTKAMKATENHGKSILDLAKVSKAGATQYTDDLQSIFHTTIKKVPNVITAPAQLMLPAPTKTSALLQKLTESMTTIGTKMPTLDAISGGLISAIRSVPIIGQRIAGRGVEDPALQRRLFTEARGRIGGIGTEVAKGGGTLSKSLRTGAVWTAGALSVSALVGAIITGPGKIMVGEAVEGLGSKIGNELTQGIGKALQIQGMQQYSEMAAWLGFMAEDVFQPMTMQIHQAVKAGQYETARDLTEGLNATILGFTGAKKSVEGLQKEIAKKFKMEDAEALMVAEGLLKAYDAQAKMMLQVVEVNIPQMIEAAEAARSSQEAIFKGLGYTYEEGVQALINQERTLNALELRQKGVNLQTNIYNKLLKSAEATMSTVTQARFEGEIGAERKIFKGQIGAMEIQEEMLEGYGPTSQYGKDISAQRLLQTKGSFETMTIQRRLLDHAKGTVMYETEAKALMVLTKEQQKQSLDFQLLHEDEIIAFEEKRIKLDEANASVQLLQLQYALSFGRMRREIQLNVREIEDDYLRVNGLLFDGTENVNKAVDNATTAYSLARKSAIEYTIELSNLEGQTITLYTAMVKTILEIEKLRGYDILIDSGGGGGSGGGGSGGSSGGDSGGGGGSSGGRTWADYSDSELFAMLRAGGTGAYGAASELKNRGFTPNEDSPYKDYFHSGGFITSDRIISVQKGERVIAKEHASSGEVTLIVNNSFTSVSMSDQEVISETISDSILNKLREAKGII